MNREEFSARIESSRPKLMKIAKAMVRSSDCEDAVQSAILSAWEHLSQLRSEAAFDAWLVRIVVNQCRQIQRGYQKEKKRNAALLAGSHKTDVQETTLEESLEKLSEEERNLILQHYRQGRTIKELADGMGKSEDAMKMRLYRARKQLRMILLSLLLLILLMAVAVGTGMIDTNWFLQNRRAEPSAIQSPIEPNKIEIGYCGNMLQVEVSDALWNRETLSAAFVYSIAGNSEDALVVHSGNIGVDGVHVDHIWTDEGIMPITQWAAGKPVYVFSVDGWRLNGTCLTGSGDYLPDGRGETFMSEVYLDWIRPEQYETLLDENNTLAFEADLVLTEYASGTALEAEQLTLRIDAPTVQEWREMYEAFYR